MGARTSVVWIHRPNQYFHTHFAVLTGFALMKRGENVRIYVCLDKNVYCSVKDQYDVDLGSDECSQCVDGIAFLKNMFDYVKETKRVEGEGRISLEYVDTQEPRKKIRPEEVHQEFKSFTENYCVHKIPQENGGYEWISEMCTLTKETIIDLAQGELDKRIYNQIEMYLAQREIARKVIEKHSPEKLIVYNGRMTSAKAWINAFVEKELKYIVHETGYGKDSMTLNCNWSVEEHFNKLPKQFFPAREELIKYAYNDKVLERYLDYMLPKVTGQKTYYESDIIGGYHNTHSNKRSRGNKVEKKIQLLILASSFDEISNPVPFDRSRLEIEYIKKLVTSYKNIKTLVGGSININIRLHPRSATQYENSRKKGGYYFSKVNEIKQYILNEKISGVEIHLPSYEGGKTSYELMRDATHVISLFSIAAIEASSLGIRSCVHERGRGSTIYDETLRGDSPDEICRQTLSWLNRNVSCAQLKEEKKLARIFLGIYLESTYVYPKGFRFFNPFKDREGEYLTNLMKVLRGHDWWKDQTWDKVCNIIKGAEAL